MMVRKKAFEALQGPVLLGLALFMSGSVSKPYRGRL